MVLANAALTIPDVIKISEGMPVAMFFTTAASAHPAHCFNVIVIVAATSRPRSKPHRSQQRLAASKAYAVLYPQQSAVNHITSLFIRTPMVLFNIMPMQA
jgi:hypothetical protein